MDVINRITVTIDALAIGGDATAGQVAAERFARRLGAALSAVSTWDEASVTRCVREAVAASPPAPRGVGR